VDFDVANQLLIRYLSLVRYRKIKGSIIGEYTSYLEISRRHTPHSWGKHRKIFSLNLAYL
jgi:hypothetical protein